MPRPRALDHRAHEEERAAIGLAQRRFEADLCAVMATAQGRRFAWWIFRMGNVFDSVLKSSGLNPQALAIQEGRRDLAIDLKAQIERVAPQEYVQMIQEQLQAAAEERERQMAAEAKAKAAPTPEDSNG